jgi:hypothetical protein
MDIAASPFKNKGSSMLSKLLQILLAAMLFTSCSSVSVRKTERLAKTSPSRMPEKIFVKPFEFYEQQVRVDRSGPALDEFKYDLQEMITRNLVRRLSKTVAPTKAIAATAPLPKGNYWLITGRVDKVHQGSRALRGLIGFGAGGTKLETSVLISDLSTVPPRKFLLIETSGGSNVTPGVLGSASFFVTGISGLMSLGNAVEAVRTGVTFDTVRTTREITASISEYLYQQGQIPYEKATGPKRLGEMPNAYWPFNQTREPKGSISVTPAAPAN